MRPQFAPDLEVAALAVRQAGAVSARQLRGIGLSGAAIRRRVIAGRLHPVHRGIYAVGHPGLSPVGFWWAAVLACGPGAVLSHASAGLAWNLRLTAAVLIDVSIASRAGRAKRASIRVHRPARLEADEITTLDGLPITTPARTLLDLAAMGVRGRPLEAVLDRAELIRRVDWGDVRRLLARYPDRSGSRALASTLDRYTAGSIQTLSHLEEIVLELCDGRGLPRPLVNAVVAGRRRDFYWPQARLVVEADGYASHHSPSAFDEDRERDVELALVRAVGAS
jgi:hypothetical protein